jgi:hypothetical protein
VVNRMGTPPKRLCENIGILLRRFDSDQMNDFVFVARKTAILLGFLRFQGA